MTRWILEALAAYLTTSGALLVFIAHQRMPLPPLEVPFSLEDMQKLQVLHKHHRRLTYALALLAAGLVFQCVVLFFPS